MRPVQLSFTLSILCSLDKFVMAVIHQKYVLKKDSQCSCIRCHVYSILEGAKVSNIIALNWWGINARHNCVLKIDW